VLAQLQQLPRHAAGQIHAAAVTVGMAELDQVVQQLLIQDRQATAAIAGVPTRVVGAVPTRVVVALARLGLVALLQRAEAATAAALPRAGGSEPCAAVRAGADQALSNGALIVAGAGQFGQLARPEARRVPGTQPAGKSTMHSSRLGAVPGSRRMEAAVAVHCGRAEALAGYVAHLLRTFRAASDTVGMDYTR
jgi:hypothetical protein